MPQRNGRGNEPDEFRYEIIKHYGVLSTSGRGWTKEFNLIRWNNRKAKYDLRDWNPEHNKMSKGVTLTEDELKMFMNLLEENPGHFMGREEQFVQSAPRHESKAAEEQAYAESELSGETDTREFAGELYETEIA